MKIDRVDVRRGAILELLTSQEVADDLTARGERIAERASSDPADFEVVTKLTRIRARVSVVTASWAARRAEARSRVLSSAFDAGR